MPFRESAQVAVGLKIDAKNEGLKKHNTEYNSKSADQSQM